MKIRLAIVTVMIVLFCSCDILNNVNSSLSDSEISEGLKKALVVGSDTAVSLTNKLDGYYKDAAIKILLPSQAQVVYNYMNNPLLSSIGISSMAENVVVALNRAAEDAAVEAKPILVNAITSMTITDGLSILKGTNPLSKKKSNGTFDSLAATHYLEDKTLNDLTAAYSPKINTSLNKGLVANVSPNSIYNTFTSTYNGVANNSFGIIPAIADVNLGDYVTSKALDGLFVKIGNEERKIRKNPYAYAEDILKKVFGSVVQ
jgi:hypothetical protein